jgi:hypothetical protein
MWKHARTMREPSHRRSSRLDWGRIEAWAQQVARGDLGQVNMAFEANGDLAPRVLWQPTSSQIQTTQLRFLWDYWTKLKGAARVPARRSVDLARVAPISSSLLDVVGDGRDFRFRRFGAAVLAVAGDDLTGRLLSEHAIGSAAAYLIESAIAFYRAAYRRAEPVYIDHAPAVGIIPYGRYSLLLPLADDAAAVAGFLLGAVPIGAGGLPLPTRL